MILNENQIKKIVIEVTITYFKRWKLSDSLIQNISHQVFLICQKQEIEDKIEASRIVKSYLRDCIEHTLFGNPNSKLNNIFFNPYKEYYDHVNKEYHFEDCETNYKLFIDSVIDTIYEGIRESYYYRFRKSLESNYYKKRKIYERKTNNETPKYIPKYYETIFKGSKDLLREMMSYLSVEEKEIFESATFMNYQFLPILRKINNGIKAYFMVTYLKYDPEKKKKTIKALGFYTF